jgi:aspartate ammonia-lyase
MNMNTRCWPPRHSSFWAEKKGDYALVHPLEREPPQSTNDVSTTAVRIAAIRLF